MLVRPEQQQVDIIQNMLAARANSVAVQVVVCHCEPMVQETPKLSKALLKAPLRV